MERKVGNLVGRPKAWRGRERNRRERKSAVQADGSSDGARGEEGAAEVDEDLRMLLRVLPHDLCEQARSELHLRDLIEVVLDLGRRPSIRFPTGEMPLRDDPVSREELDDALNKCGPFGSDNRAGMEGTLHRISCIRTRSGDIVGLTCRAGRAVSGSASLAQQEISNGSSILFLGRPGVGKTTTIREASRSLADDLNRRVVVVDTSNEIGGDGDVPHPGLGSARRMQVSERGKQHEVMIEAVENHFPEVIVIDEIGTTEEALAARTIAQRGVQLLATAHGHTLNNLMKNPSLVELVGGIQSVTLGDDTARARGVQKAVQERAAPPTFDCAVEMADLGCWRVYNDVGDAVDRMLAGRVAPPLVRMTDEYKRTHSEEQQSRAAGTGFSHGSSTATGSGVPSTTSLPVSFGGSNAQSLWDTPEGISCMGKRPPSSPASPSSPRSSSTDKVVQVYPFQVSVYALNHVIETLGLEQYMETTEKIDDADAVLLVKAAINGGGGWIRLAARERSLPMFTVKSDTLPQMAKAVRSILRNSAEERDEAAAAEGRKPEPQMTDRWFERSDSDSAQERDAMEEAKSAAERIVISQGKPVELQPRPDNVLAQQAELLKRRYNLQAVPVGSSARATNWLRVLPSNADASLAAPE